MGVKPFLMPPARRLPSGGLCPCRRLARSELRGGLLAPKDQRARRQRCPYQQLQSSYMRAPSTIIELQVYYFSLRKYQIVNFRTLTLVSEKFVFEITLLFL
jgi:hypothetical protein